MQTWECSKDFFFQTGEGHREWSMTGIQTCSLPIFSTTMFTNKIGSDNKNHRVEPAKRIIKKDKENEEEFIKIANIIYESSNIISDQKLPYTDHFSHPKRIEKWNENIRISTAGSFQGVVEKLGDIWISQLQRREKVKKKYGGITEDLEFDKIDFAPENIGEYLRLKNQTHLFLKKMSSTMKMTPNAMEEGLVEDVGMLNMQLAVQRVAAQNNRIQIFEQDDLSKIEEEWAIVDRKSVV